LLGKGIAHSRSPEMYRRLLGMQLSYDLLDISEAADLPGEDWLRSSYQGVNITTPWKAHYAKYATAEVRDLNAVNCLGFRHGEMLATNTDWMALDELVPQFVKLHRPSIWVLLGNGVMARVMTKVFKERGIEFIQYARSLGDDLASLQLPQAHQGASTKVVVNTCSRGFVFNGNLDATWVFWDFNYADPAQEASISRSKARYVDGLGLLELQAKHAIKFWNGLLTD
jgi:shikimate dehydrogenase